MWYIVETKLKIPINFFDSTSFQQRLEKIFANRFVVLPEDKDGEPVLYIWCSDDADPAEIAQVTTMANDFNNETVEKHRTRLLELIDGKSSKIIANQQFSDSIDKDAQQATEWKADTTKTCPFTVVINAKKLSITNEASADMLINQKQQYDNFLNNIRNIAEQGKLQLFNCSNLIQLKNSASLTIQSLKDLSVEDN
jgi:hypothetical protein